MKEKKVGRPLKTENDKRDKKILKMLKKGLNQTQIANELDISNGSISIRIKRMKERGVVIPNDKTIKNNEIDNQIIELLKEGLTQNDIASKLDLTYGQMIYRLKKIRERGLLITNKKKIDNNEILELINKGLNKTQIAQKMGVKRSTISLRIKKMKERGVYIPENNEPLDQKDNKIIELSEKGLTQAKISEMLGVSQQTIHNRIKKMKNLGIKIPDQRKNKKKKNNKKHNSKKEQTDIIVQKILDLMITKKANVNQVMSIAKIYQVDKEVEKLLKDLKEEEIER